MSRHSITFILLKSDKVNPLKYMDSIIWSVLFLSEYTWEWGGLKANMIPNVKKTKDSGKIFTTILAVELW